MTAEVVKNARLGTHAELIIKFAFPQTTRSRRDTDH